jgi:hypothetical protein
MKLRTILESILKGGKFKVYHGSKHQFTKFDLIKMAQNAIWFSDSIQDIKSGGAGADSVEFIMEFEIMIKNPAGWDEYDNLSIDELERDGFDGVILEQSEANHYIVFNPKNIKFIRNID